MDTGSINNIAQSAELMSKVLQVAATESTELAEKMVKMNLETQLSKTAGLGEIIDKLA